MLNMGDNVTYKRVITQRDIMAFASLINDFNKVHTDSEYMKTTKFKKTIIHGAFLSSLFSHLLGEVLPGNGCVYLAQQTSFLKPAFVDEQLTINIIITHINHETKRITCTTQIFNTEQQLIVDGEAIVVVKDNSNL